jgi:hypothetical protein
MGPVLSGRYQVDTTERHAVARRQLAFRGATFRDGATNGGYVVRRQLGCAASFAFSHTRWVPHVVAVSMWQAAFSFRVGVVCGIVAAEKVRGAHASGIVAAM